MWNVALVGHSQIPTQITLEDANLAVFRAPGGKARSFYTDDRLRSVLSWSGDICVLWVGSNDIVDGISPVGLADVIVEIVQRIEVTCGAIVIVCLVEPRLYPAGIPVDHTSYRKIQRAVNKHLQRKLSNRFVQFNTNSYVTELARDGVHFTQAGRNLIRDRIEKAVRSVTDVSDVE